MQITREADYAIRMMVDVASQPPGQSVTAQSVAERWAIPRPFLKKIVARLANAGLLRTRRGHAGGMMLGRPAAEISLYDVIEATQGVIAINDCVLDPETCEFSATCPVYYVCLEVRTVVARIWKSATLDQLVKQRHSLERGWRPSIAAEAVANVATEQSSETPIPLRRIVT